MQRFKRISGDDNCQAQTARVSRGSALFAAPVAIRPASHDDLDTTTLRTESVEGVEFMRILKILGIVLLGLVLILVLGGLLLPAQVHVERSQQISASPERVFSLIDNFQEFNRWSPWAARDPKTQYHFEGPERGVGA
jgi:hypothetical protein